MDFTIFSLWNLDLTFPFRKQVLNTFIPAPEEVSAYTIVSLAAGRGEGGSIRARSSPDLVGEGRGSDKGLTYDRFDDLDGPGRAPVMDNVNAVGLRSRNVLLRQTEG
jgi:hypothetical protein